MGDMYKHDFAPLRQHYPSVIETLPDTFNSHEFIIALAQRHQALYVEALHAYLDQYSPFQVVHGIIARSLDWFPELVENTGEHVPSRDIFGNANTAALWRKR